MNHEWTCVDVADRIDQAHHSTCSAHVEPGQRITEGIQVEERVSGQNVLAMREEPFVDLALLGVGRMKFVPCIGTSTRGAKASDAQLGSIGIGKPFELVELRDVVASHDHRNLEGAEPGIAQRFAQMGIYLHTSSPGALAELVRREIPKWGEVVRKSNIRME